MDIINWRITGGGRYRKMRRERRKPRAHTILKIIVKMQKTLNDHMIQRTNAYLCNVTMAQDGTDEVINKKEK